MTLSKCRIVNGNLKADQEKLVLTVDFLNGQPKVGDCIYLKEQYYLVHFYKIQKINKPLLNKHHELTLDFKEPPWMWKERIFPHIREQDNTAVCGISIEEFYNHSSPEKFDYVKQIIDFISPDRVGDFLKSNLKYAVKLILKDIEGQTALTKFGGLPKATADFSFPKGKDGKSAIFIAQINIAELNQWSQATKEFKETGVLYFFATIKNADEDEDEYESFEEIIVKYSSATDNLIQIELPDDIKEYGVLEEKDLMIAEEINIPAKETSLWNLKEMSDDERNRYWYMEAIIGEMNCFSAPKLLGHPNQIQGCVLLEAELKSTHQGWFDPNGFDRENSGDIVKAAEPGARTWRHLFEIDPLNEYFRKLSNYDGEINEYMDGRFFVMIKQEHLEKLDFNNTVTIYQCT